MYTLKYKKKIKYFNQTAVGVFSITFNFHNTLHVYSKQLILLFVMCSEYDSAAGVHKLFLMQEQSMFYFHKCYVKKIECTSLLVKIGINYPQAIISMKLMKFSVGHSYYEGR